MKTKNQKRGRRLMGKQKRVTTSVRLEPRIKIQIEKTYGSVQKFFDEKIRQEVEGAVAEIPVKEKVTIDDF